MNNWRTKGASMVQDSWGEEVTYPFTVDRWTPDKVFSGGYKACAHARRAHSLSAGLPGRTRFPDQYGQSEQWFMDGGTAQPHIPLSALASVLRPEFGGA